MSICNFWWRVLKGLDKQRLIVVTGKGGVGKTTIAAALALESAAQGQKTLICEVNTKERIAPLLVGKEAGPELTQIEPNLWAVDVRPHEAMREYALMILKFESIYKAVFENRLVKYFLRFIPSLQELVLLGKILYHLRDTDDAGKPRFDRVIIDAPATGHAISFLSVPQVILDTVPPGALANDATWMRDLLIDPAMSAVVLVSLPEELPVNETIELADALKTRVRVRPAATVLNAFTTERFTPEQRAEVPAELIATFDRHRVLSEASRVAIERLAMLELPITTVPRMHVTEFNRSSIEEISKSLRQGT